MNEKNKQFIIEKDTGNVYEVASVVAFMISRKDFFVLTNKFLKELKESKNKWEFDKLFVYGQVNGKDCYQHIYTKRVGDLHPLGILSNKYVSTQTISETGGRGSSRFHSI